MHDLSRALVHDRTRRRRWSVSVAAGAVVVAAAALVFSKMVAEDTGPSMVQRIAADVRAAAARGAFVYPTPDDASGTTAFRQLRVLESVGEGGAARARAMAQEITQTLVRLGDRYWDLPGGRPFAADYYASTLLFDADNPRARQRVLLSPGEIAWLRERAAAGDFSIAERTAGALLRALAASDDGERLRLLVDLYSSPEGVASSTGEHIEMLLGAREAAALLREVRQRRAVMRPVEAADAGTPPFIQAAPTTTPSRAVPARHAREALAQARVGAAALRRGGFIEAERALLHALTLDENCVPALSTLGDLSFERGRYDQALLYTERAARLDPSRGELRMRLGDVYLKVLRFPDAVREYKAAQALGRTEAGARLALVAARIAQERQEPR